MKPFLLFITLITAVMFSAQNVSCAELVRYAKSTDSYPDVVRPISSSMIAKAEYYRVNGGGLVVAYLKSNDYDTSGRPYIFCGISSARWSKFKSEGMYGSWGKAFHAYIRDYTCNCN